MGSIPVAQPLFEKKDSNAPVVPLPSRTTITRGTNEEGIPWSSLQIKDSDKTDRRVFICQASVVGTDPNPEDCKESKSKHCDRTETILRVKDPLAAVWPFCGIVVEVILLCVIIFSARRRKRHQKRRIMMKGQMATTWDLVINENKMHHPRSIYNPSQRFVYHCHC